MPEKLPTEKLHSIFLESIGIDFILAHTPLKLKPLEIDMMPPLPTRVRLYIYNATNPPGGRPLGERKILLKVPGQTYGSKGNFDMSGGRIVLLVGYEREHDLFILWDGCTYQNFAFNRNTQVKADTVFKAYTQGIAFQEKRRRDIQNETIVVCESCKLKDAIMKRMDLTIERLRGNA